METVDLTPTWKELRPLAIDIVKKYIPAKKDKLSYWNILKN